MKIGCCASLEKIYDVKKAGYDYIELYINQIAALSDEELKNLKQTLKDLDLPCFVTSRMFPGGYFIVGENVNYAKNEEYIKKAFKANAELGVKYVVFGSGKVKEIPEGKTYEETYAQIVDFCRMAAVHAKENGLTILIEALNAKECNIIISIKEAEKLVRELNLPEVKILFDDYHSKNTNEDVAVLDDIKDILLHTHYAVKEDRSFPIEEKTVEKEFVEKLKEIGFDGGISMEPFQGDDGYLERATIANKVFRKYL